jgi:tetratricopeptide (TPR) repeat protein
MRFSIKLIRALLVLPLLAAPSPLFAADYADKAQLDELFAELKVAHSPDEATDIVAQIWAAWFNPDIPDLADRMNRMGIAMHSGDFSTALGDLTAIIKDYPDYAEGWNQRATLYYMMGRFNDSLADITKVLELEPRHFGALSGRVMIELKQGKRADALRDMIAALAIDPYLDEKKLFPELQHNTTNV